MNIHNHRQSASACEDAELKLYCFGRYRSGNV